ncbi:MAG: hypothetical protein M3Q58_03205 [Bacteroidota bacterium]|nr:hypothetical protein [Bacteroidota bacterium]
MKTSILKNYWFLGGIGITLIAAIAYLAISPVKIETTEQVVENENELTDKTAIPFILPPLKGEEIEFTAYKINAGKGGLIKHNDGTSISIPPHCFLDENGKAILDTVTIVYREFKNPLEIFLSGIPMQYDSAGTLYTFESAGMLEIQAYVDNKPVQINKEKSINIEMPSIYSDTKYNLYSLDTEVKNWIYLGKDKVEDNSIKLKKENEIILSPNQEYSDLIKPCKANPEKYSFKLAFKKSEYPELACYDNVLFEVVDDNFSQKFYKLNWDNITLEKSKDIGVFMVNLQKADTSISVKTVPVFEGKDYEKAKLDFERNFTAYNNDVSEKNKINNEKLKSINKKIETTLPSQSLSINRVFRINNTGIYNVDYPMPPLISPIFASVNFISNDKEKIIYDKIFIVEKGINTVYRYTNQNINFMPGSKYLMWVVTENNDFAFCTTTNLEKLVNNNKMEIIPEMISDKTKALKKIEKFSS